MRVKRLIVESIFYLWPDLGIFFFLWDISFFLWDIINPIVMGKPTTRPNKKNIRKGPKESILSCLPSVQNSFIAGLSLNAKPLDRLSD